MVTSVVTKANTAAETSFLCRVAEVSESLNSLTHVTKESRTYQISLRKEKKRSVMTITTLCYIENKAQYLMLHRTKKQNDINRGKWIGVGGHVESQESPEECLVREVKEETGLILTSYKLRGLVTFVNSECESELMCVFTADEYTGDLITCEEGELQWIDKAQVPDLPTWEGDRVFLELLLSGEQRFFSIKLQYEGDRLVEKKINLY